MSHFESAPLYTKRRYIVLLITVVVGSVVSPALYIAFHARARAVQLSFIRIRRRFPSTGDPEGAANVGAVARAVTVK